MRGVGERVLLQCVIRDSHYIARKVQLLIVLRVGHKTHGLGGRFQSARQSTSVHLLVGCRSALTACVLQSRPWMVCPVFAIACLCCDTDCVGRVLAQLGQTAFSGV